MSHMTLDDRILIQEGLDNNLSIRIIAKQIGKSPSTDFLICIRNLHTVIMPMFVKKILAHLQKSKFFETPIIMSPH